MKEGYLIKNIKFKYEVEPFCCECSLTNDALDTLFYIYEDKGLKYSSIAIITNEDLTEKITKYLLTTFDINVNYINFDKDDYSDAYGIVLSLEDDELTLSIEKVLARDGYKLFDLDYLYVDKEVDKAFVRKQLEYETDIDIFKIVGDCE